MAECIMSGNGFIFNGERYEILTFIPAATYSLNAKITSETPFDTSAYYFGQIDYVGTQMATTRYISPSWFIKLCNVAVPTVSSNGLCINAMQIYFSKNGDTQGTLNYLARQTLSSNAVSSTSPGSMNIGPIWMVKKV